MDLPRPEYPEPQFQRHEWLNLNGTWEFAFDDNNQGRKFGWHRGTKPLPLRITVPFPYQCELSGINDKGVHEIVWYARDLVVPPQWREDLLLHFGAVDYKTTVWINGKLVGNHQGGHVPFSFEIAPYLRPGNNRLVLRVEDSQDPKQPRGKQASSGVPHEIDYFCTTGIWQTVWLEPVPSTRIQYIRLEPSARDNSFRCTVSLHAHSDRWRVQVEVFDHGEPVAAQQKIVNCASAELNVVIPYAKYWTPDNPHLYDIRVKLFQRDDLIDWVDSYVGIRDVEIMDGRLLLNGEPVYMAMVLDQGYWPESYLAPPSDEALKADVEWVKRFGYNSARKHQKIEDPRWLYWCDKLGVMVWEEMPNAREWSSESEELLAGEWKKALRRDFNHPCIVTWVPVNESMGFPGLPKHPGQYAFIERMVSMTREMDGQRPVIDNDGWEHTDITDICAIHDYTPTAALLRERYKERLEGGSLPSHGWIGRPLFALGSSYRGQPVMLSEVGGFLNIPPDVPPDKRDFLYQMYGSIQSNEELMAKYEDLMEGIASLPFVSGFCYTQLTDIEQEQNGLLTYDRRSKIDPEQLAGIHSRLFANFWG